MISEKVEVRDSEINGKGLFAKEKILKDEIIWWEDEENPTRKYYTKEQIQIMDYKTKNYFIKYSYKVKENLWALDFGPDKYTNHSCNPNTYNSLNQEWSTVARRNIEIEEEITIDYGIIMTYVWYMNMTCNCGAFNCRKIITKNDYKLPELRIIHAGRLDDYLG